MALRLTCEECDIASTCKKEQKARLEPCRDIVPTHCAEVMKLVRIEPRRHLSLGPIQHYLCLKCKGEACAGTFLADAVQTRSLGDPIKPRMSKDDMPETGYSTD